MAVYVLLQFDHDDAAKVAVKDILEHKGTTQVIRTDKEETIQTALCTVWGIFQKPTKFCTCEGGKKTASGFTKGKKYGWWICSKCMKPTALWASGRQWFSVLGTNLLPRSLRPYPDEMSPNNESPAVWNDLPTVENPE